MNTIHLFSSSADTSFHQLFRAVLAQQNDICLAVEMDAPEQLLSLTQGLKPDVFVLDWQYPCHDGSRLLNCIHAMSPETKTLLLCDVCGQPELAVALAQGARGLILKTAPPDHWLKAVRGVSRGQLWFGRELLANFLGGLFNKPEVQAAVMPAEGVLTHREKEVAQWVERGMSNKEIAREMTISDATVKTHLQHIFTKLKVDRRMRIAHPTMPSFSSRLPMPY